MNVVFCFAVLVVISSNDVLAKDNEIYGVLLKSSNLKIKQQYCGSSPRTISEYLSGYLIFVNSNPTRLNAGFDCSNIADEKNCTLSYGQKPKWFGQEGWQRVLRFKYDFKEKAIYENTVTCIDIP